jgi:protein TonB
MRKVFSLLVALAATCAVFSLVVFMNLNATRPPDFSHTSTVAFDAPPPDRKPPARKKRKKPKPKRKQRKAAPPKPVLAAAMGGLDLGLDGFGPADLGDATDALLGDTSNVVMTAETVDDLPVPVRRVAADYPTELRKRGITGLVRLSILVGADGSVQDVRVESSDPEGLFDQAAVGAVRQWEFNPARYQGQPVPIRIILPFRFDLDLE